MSPRNCAKALSSRGPVDEEYGRRPTPVTPESSHSPYHAVFPADMTHHEYPPLEVVQPQPGPVEPRARLGARGRVALGFFALAAAYFLWTEHRAHTIQLLPWAILALCPLMHVFMHRGHGGHGGHGSGPDAGERGREP